MTSICTHSIAVAVPARTLVVMVCLRASQDCLASRRGTSARPSGSVEARHPRALPVPLLSLPSVGSVPPDLSSPRLLTDDLSNGWTQNENSASYSVTIAC